jgi:hypothetical protein
MFFMLVSPSVKVMIAFRMLSTRRRDTSGCRQSARDDHFFASANTLLLGVNHGR